MWMLVINIILILIMVLSILSLFLLKKGWLSKTVAISLIVLTTIAGLINNYQSFAKNPFSQNVGILTPKYKISYKQEEPKISLYGDSQSQTYTVRMKENVVVQPFGRMVPFSLERTEKGLLISMVMQSSDGKITAKMIRNKWVLNPNNYFRKNFDAHALEVIDEFDIPVLQIEYLDAITLKIGGVFFPESANISSIYHDFPSVPDNVGEVALFSMESNVIILGKGVMITLGKPNTPSEKEEIRTIAKSSIETWFDYSDPEKIGIRKKQEVDKSVAISKRDRKKYSNLTNEQLKDKALTFVHDLRELLSMCDKEIEAAWDTFKSGGDSNALRAFESDECKQRTEAEYNRRFKIEAIILRDELISRTPNVSVDSLPSSFYENPVNLFVCDYISNDIEKLASNL